MRRRNPTSGALNPELSERLQDEETCMARVPPIAYGELAALFTYLNRPNPRPCSHSLTETSEFLVSRGLPVEPTVRWLKANGGFCDCEVILNVAYRWGARVGWEAEDEDG
jgi:hypothetical protein